MRKESSQRAPMTYQVGPSRQHTTLQSVAPALAPGDVVEVDGGAVYPGDVRLIVSGAPDAPIIVRGVPAGGARPVIEGGYNTVVFRGNHTVFEGFELRGGEMRCVYHRAHDVTVRDTVIHGCANHGVLSSDDGSGSLTLERVEIYDAGSGDSFHPIYAATDEATYPGALFRLIHSYIHDGRGGNQVKSRAERNEIAYNWIEGAHYKELDLVGPDGSREDVREDSDVVGNVLWKTNAHYVARVGGDGTGETFGRYRFLNNTIVLAEDATVAIHVSDGIDSLELHNNVFFKRGGGPFELVNDEGYWAAGPSIAGSRNFLPPEAAAPAGMHDTMTGADPGFADLIGRDVRLTAQSVLVDAGADAPASPGAHPFPDPIPLPTSTPPLPGRAEPQPRSTLSRIDIGAFELMD